MRTGWRLQRLITAGAALVIASGCASGSRHAGDSIPVPLATALLDNTFGSGAGSRTFAVESLPSGFPAELLPPGPVRIVGGMAAADGITVVLADSTRRLAAVLEEHFEDVGFRRPPPSPGHGFSSASGPAGFFCSDSATVTATPLTGAERDMVRVNYRRHRSNAFCTPRREPATAILELPPLEPPPGVHVGRSGSGSGGDGVNSRARMTGAALVPGDVLAHYTAQLVAAGWTSSAPAVSSKVAAEHFEARDSASGTWEGVLVVTGGENVLNLTLNMQRKTTP